MCWKIKFKLKIQGWIKLWIWRFVGPPAVNNASDGVQICDWFNLENSMPIQTKCVQNSSTRYAAQACVRQTPRNLNLTFSGFSSHASSPPAFAAFGSSRDSSAFRFPFSSRCQTSLCPSYLRINGNETVRLSPLITQVCRGFFNSFGACVCVCLCVRETAR